jgi:membrane protease subunit HflK
MNDPHDHSSHKHDHPKEPVTPSQPEPVEDAGSAALSEALHSSFAIVKVIMIILVVVFFASGFFTVSSQERAIILRFGRAVGSGEQQLLGPGAHWKFPYPIDEAVRIPYSEFQTVRSTTGWYATTPEMEATKSEPPPNSTLSPAADGYTLTSDGNIIHVRATLRYKINKPLKYALGFVNASNLVQNALNNALFHASARFTVDQALTSDKLRFKEKITERVQQVVDQQELGITVEQVELNDTIAPRYVNPAFESVLAADVERRQSNEVAQAYSSRILSTALGESNAVINAGLSDRARLVEAVAAEAKYFTNQLPYYRSNPQLFASRLRTEALHRVLTNTSVEKIFLPAGKDGKSRELRIQLSREPQEPARQQP